MNIGPATLKFKRAEIENCAATLLPFDDRHSFGTLAFRNALEYRNLDISRLIDYHFCTVQPVKIVRYGSVTPEFKT